MAVQRSLVSQVTSIVDGSGMMAAECFVVWLDQRIRSRAKEAVVVQGFVVK